MAGSYRPITGRVFDVDHEFIKYNHETDQLLLSDLDILTRKTIEEQKDGKFIALKIGFSLNSSHYATMAIRELMKGLARGQ